MGSDEVVKFLVETKTTFGKKTYYHVKGVEKERTWVIIIDDEFVPITKVGHLSAKEGLEIDDFKHNKISYESVSGKKKGMTGKVLHVYMKISKPSATIMKRSDIMLSTGEGYRKGPLGSVYKKWY